MDDRTARWTEAARSALHHAEAEARQRNHDYVGQEHLLLGLLLVDDGAAAAILQALDVRPEVIRSEVEVMVGRVALAPAQRAYTPRLQAALDLAAEEATGFEHAAVGTDHLLLGMLREGQGVGADILRARGVTLSRARDQALRLHATGHVER
jgi:ATP-dependent Clp protease ATP-binding subunit ClpC